MIMIIRRAVVVLAAVLTTVALLAGCAGYKGRVEADPVLTDCHDYRAHTLFGRFTIQQEKKGAPMQWAAYPKEHLTGDRYEFTLRLNGKMIERKNQHYPPHGSLPAATMKKYSGKSLEISGRVLKGGKLMLAYSMRCWVL